MNRDRQPLPLAEAVRRQQTRATLPEDRLQALLALQRDAAARPAPRRPLRNPSRRTGVMMSAAAGIALAFVLGWWLAVSLTVQQPGEVDLLARIADEVAANHLKKQPVEVHAEDLPTLRAWFTELDFQLVESPLIAAADLDLLGGRYCSIQGGIAAQLRLHDADGARRTLYQSRYDRARHGPIPDRLAGEPPRERTARGVPVRLWREHGVLFALAGG